MNSTDREIEHGHETGNGAHISSIRHLLQHCGSLKVNETLCILCDPTTKDIASAFRSEAANIVGNIHFFEIPLADKHGIEPPEEVTCFMLQSDLIISLCRFSLAHSQARIDAGQCGARFLSMPFYDWQLLADPCLTIDYKKQGALVRRVADILTGGNIIHVSSCAGTDITLKGDGRVGNYCPGMVENPRDLGSPPDVEANISPIESQSNGIIVVDGSITCPEIGLLTCPVVLRVEDGRITRIESENSAYVDILVRMFEDRDSKRRILAECGIGLNPEARLTGTMLTDEGAMGCVHFGFGSNYTVGGLNKVDYHLDFVIQDATLEVDGRPVLSRGEVLL